MVLVGTVNLLERGVERRLGSSSTIGIRTGRKRQLRRSSCRGGLTEAESHRRDLGYIPLPGEVASLSLAALARIQ